MHESQSVVDEPIEDLERPTMILVASSSATNGVLEIIEDTRDDGSGPPPHVHVDHDEAFYVLDGHFSFIRDHDEIDVAPGGFVFVPRGTRHAYLAHRDGSRLLFIYVPGGMAGFLRDQGRLMASGVPVREAMETLSDRYDTHPAD